MKVRVLRRFRDLLDVTFGTPSDGYVPVYDSGTGKLVMAAAPGGGADVPFVGTSPPGSPTDGELWWDTDDDTPASGGSSPGSIALIPRSFGLAFEVGNLVDPWQNFGYDQSVPIPGPGVGSGVLTNTAASSAGHSTANSVVLSRFFVNVVSLLDGESLDAPLDGGVSVLVWLVSNPAIFCNLSLDSCPALTSDDPFYTLQQADISIASQDSTHFSLGADGQGGTVLTDQIGYYQAAAYLPSPPGYTAA